MAKAQAESIDSALAPLREAMAPPKPTAADDAMLRLAQYEADAAIGQLKSAGSAAFKTGDFVRAVQFWEKAAQLTKSQTEQSVLFSNMSAASCATAQGLILAGFKAEAEKHYTAALEAARKCNDLRPDWGKSYARLGAALHGLKRMDAAIRAYKEGLLLAPGDPGCERGLADAQAAMTRHGGSWSTIGKRADDCDYAAPGEIYGPTFMVVLPDGDLAVSDQHTNQVAVMAPSGKPKRILSGDPKLSWSTRPAGSGKHYFMRPLGIASDGRESVFVCDCNNSRVQKLSYDGKFLGLFARSGSRLHELAHPCGLAYEPTSGRLYVGARVAAGAREQRLVLVLLSRPPPP